MDSSAVPRTVMIKRKPNWTERELLALSETVTDNISVIRGQFCPGLTIQDKNKCWSKVAGSVNAVNCSGLSRTVQDCKKKWQDIQGATKKKEAARRGAARATGGGPPPPNDLKPWESNVLKSLTNTQVEGIAGGIDTMDVDLNDSSCTPSEIWTSTDIEEATIPDHLPFDNIDETPECSFMSGDLSVSNEEPKTGKTKKYSINNKDKDKDLQRKFLGMEEEKTKREEEYRKKKLELLERKVIASEKIAEMLSKLYDSTSNSQIIYTCNP